MPGLEHVACDLPRQVYREIDDDGMVSGDLIAPINEDLPSGMPLLVPLVADGVRIGHFPMEATAWQERQELAMPNGDVPVRKI